MEKQMVLLRFIIFTQLYFILAYGQYNLFAQRLYSVNDPDYPALHFWDKFNFSDATLIAGGQLEQNFIRYIGLLSQVKQETAVLSIKQLLFNTKEKNNKIYDAFLQLSKKYFHDPNSPVRNDEWYIPVAEFILSDHTISETEKLIVKAEWKMMMKNRVGRRAENFTYTLASGKTGTLYGIKSEYTLIYFYNPDCHACSEILAALKNSEIIHIQQQSGKLKILAFYPDADLSIWKIHLPDMPAEWINGYDKEQTVEKNNLYNLQAIPSMYLLDKEKKVVLKDVDFQLLENWLMF